MKVLLDTHVFLWALKDDPRLSKRVQAILRDDGHTLLWSAVSTWELAIKASLKRIRFTSALATYLPAKLEAERIETLPITSAHAAATESLPFHHRDPFDRLLVAQAQVEGIPILSADKNLRSYDVEVIF